MAFAKRTIKWNLISTILICQIFIGRLVRLRFKSSILLTIRNQNLQLFSHATYSMTVGSFYNHRSFTRLTIVHIMKFIWCKGQYLKYCWIICCDSQNCLLKQIFYIFYHNSPHWCRCIKKALFVTWNTVDKWLIRRWIRILSDLNILSKCSQSTSIRTTVFAWRKRVWDSFVGLLLFRSMDEK